jgi:hypothetical protein
MLASAGENLICRRKSDNKSHANRKHVPHATIVAENALLEAKSAGNSISTPPTCI